MEEAKAFELHIDDITVDAGAVPVRWCLGRELVENVSTKESCVVIVVQALDMSPSTRERTETRQVLAIDDLMTYVTFAHPGRNRIYAFLVARSLKETRKSYLSREEGRRSARFDKMVTSRHFDPDDEDFCAVSLGSYGVQAMTSRDVDVPRELFAAEPPAWEKKWVNLWHKSPPVDQCDYRRRRIFAYTLKPFCFVAVFAARYLRHLLQVAWLVLLASRGDYWKVLLHPSGTVNQYEVGAPGSIYCAAEYRSRGDRKMFGTLARFGCSPLIVLLSYVLTRSAMVGIWSLLGALILPLVLAVLAMVGFIGAKVIDVSVDYVGRKKADSEASAPASAPHRPSLLTREDIGYLTCEVAPGKATLAALPKRRRTIRLRLQELKGKVCRPFAG